MFCTRDVDLQVQIYNQLPATAHDNTRFAGIELLGEARTNFRQNDDVGHAMARLRQMGYQLTAPMDQALQSIPAMQADGFITRQQMYGSRDAQLDGILLDAADNARRAKSLWPRVKLFFSNRIPVRVRPRLLVPVVVPDVNMPKREYRLQIYSVTGRDARELRAVVPPNTFELRIPALWKRLFGARTRHTVDARQIFKDSIQQVFQQFITDKLTAKPAKKTNRAA